MSSSSCSFRITRTAEDIAQTISSLSHRLVELERRQKSFELNLEKLKKEPTQEELKNLANIDQLISDCQQLLDEHP